MSFITCPECGAELIEGKKFCSECGAKLEAEAKPVESAAEETILAQKSESVAEAKEQPMSVEKSAEKAEVKLPVENPESVEKGDTNHG